MNDETISPLRRRMIEDMTVRNFSADTQRNYIRGVKNLAIFLARSPDTATPEELRRTARSGRPAQAGRFSPALFSQALSLRRRRPEPARRHCR